MKNSSLGKCSSNDIKKKGYKITTINSFKNYYRRKCIILPSGNSQEIIISIVYFYLFSTKNIYS